MILDNRKNSISILSSSNGTNAENIINYCFKENIYVSGVITDNKNAFVIERAKRLNVPYFIIEKKDKTRREHETNLLDVLKEHKSDYICLAGYMRVLSEDFLKNFRGDQIINIHPSLLPKYPGLNAYKRAFLSEDKYSGITIHYVNSIVDGGKIIMQRAFPRLPDDSFDSFKGRGMQLEYKLYREVLANLFNKENCEE